MYLFFVLVIISFIGVYFYRQFAIKVNIIDVPNERSSHSVPTPRGAGVAVAATWFLALCYIFFIENGIESSLFYALSGGILLSIAGIIDDIYNISANVRLFVQLFVSAWALYFLGGFRVIDLGVYSVDSILLLTPIAFIMIIWFINLFNFLDGIDGYLGIETLFICSFIGIYFKDSISLSIAAVVVGFLFLNWPKAKVFMGDVGSTLLGFNIAVLAIYYQNVGKSSIFVWIMLSSLFWFDATLTLYRRYKNKEKLMVAHRKHAYQRIVQAGFSHQKTLFYSIGINIVIIGLVMMSITFQKLSLVFLVLNVLLLYGIDKLIGFKKPFPKE